MSLAGSGMTTSISGSSGRQGTFTLEDQEAKQQRPQSALTRGTSPRSSGGAGGSHGTVGGGSSRIPTPRASVERSLSGRLSSASSSSSFQTTTLNNSHATGVNQQATTMVDSGPGSNGHSSLNNHDHPALEGEKVLKLRGIVRRLSATLNSVLDADATMRNNLHSLREDVEEIMTQTEDGHVAE